MTNRAARRAKAKAKRSVPPTPDGNSNLGQLFLSAILYGQSGVCECHACAMLRTVGPEILAAGRAATEIDPDGEE